MPAPSRVISIEEHFYTEGFELDAHPRSPLLRDLGNARLEDLDRLGIDMQVLSLMAPGVQGFQSPSEAIAKARFVNDFLASACQKHPQRFSGWAALPTQDPKAAADELERCVRDLNFRGGQVNGHTNGHYLDEEMFLPIWERASDLGVPIYLHPAIGFSKWDIIDGYPEFSRAAWGWMAETGAHALRIVGAGVFERFPKCTMILGHMGEALPYYLTRIDSRTFDRFQKRGLSMKLSGYIRRNIAVTTSGVFSTPALRCALDALGASRVIFSIDYPLESSEEAMGWLRGLPFPEAECEAVAHGNAAALLGI